MMALGSKPQSLDCQIAAIFQLWGGIAVAKRRRVTVRKGRRCQRELLGDNVEI